MTPEDEIAALEAENASQREQIAALLERVQELEARLAKDSHNSGKPPSVTGWGARRGACARRAARSRAGSWGIAARRCSWWRAPDEVVEHRPAVCAQCQTPLRGGRPVVVRERRQVQDLPPVRLQHHGTSGAARALSGLPARQRGRLPGEAPSRAQYGPRLRALAVYLLEQQLVPYARVRHCSQTSSARRSRWARWCGWVRASGADAGAGRRRRSRRRCAGAGAA